MVLVKVIQLIHLLRLLPPLTRFNYIARHTATGSPWNMQPASTSKISKLNTTTQKGSSDQRQKPVKATSYTMNVDSVNPSEDIVTLLTPQTLDQVNHRATKPSTPVSYAEMKAFYKSFRGTKRFSVKA